MRYIFSPENKFKTWRKIWIALAESQMEMGITVTKEQVEELKKYQDDINYEVAEKLEKELRHDVMAHVKAFGEQATNAAGIIHLGMTSCDVGDNADLIIMYQGLLKIKDNLPNTTHCAIVNDLDRIIDNYAFRGLKGATGTQATFLQLCGSPEKVIELERRFSEKLGFEIIMPVTGQTYPRMLDTIIIDMLKYIVFLADHSHEQMIKIIGHSLDASLTASNQWLERTLDDSASRRIYIPESFILCNDCLEKKAG